MENVVELDIIITDHGDPSVGIFFFRRNTLLEFGDIKIVVSTVGAMENLHNEGRFDTVGVNRYFETMAFYSNPEDTRYNDIDVNKEVYFESNWAIDILDADDKANEMHENVVSEIPDKLKNGEIK